MSAPMIVTILLLALGLVAMVLVISRSARKSEGTISKEHAEREGMLGEEGLRHAKERHEEHG